MERKSFIFRCSKVQMQQEKHKFTHFLVMSFLPLTNVVEVDVRFMLLLPGALLYDIDEMDVKPFDAGARPKKSSINDTPINGFINDVNNVLFWGCECR